MWGNQHVKILECRMTSLLISVGTDYRLLPADSATSCGDIIFALTQKVIVLSCTLEKINQVIKVIKVQSSHMGVTSQYQERCKNYTLQN